MRLVTQRNAGRESAFGFVRCPGRPASAAWLCDARERDLERLDVRQGVVRLPMPGSLASLRLIEASPGNPS